MRDPKRIRKFCDEFATLWESSCPDWRFGQIICNVFSGSDPFYLEDDKAMEKIRKYFSSQTEEGGGTP